MKAVKHNITEGVVLVWYNANDLRVHDHYPLCLAHREAMQRGVPLVCLFIYDFRLFAQPSEIGGFVRMTPLRVQFLNECVQSLRDTLHTCSEGRVPLFIRIGFPEDELVYFIKKINATSVYTSKQVNTHESVIQQVVAHRLNDATYLNSLIVPSSIATTMKPVRFSTLWNHTLTHIDDLATHPFEWSRDSFKSFLGEFLQTPKRNSAPFDCSDGRLTLISPFYSHEVLSDVFYNNSSLLEAHFSNSFQAFDMTPPTNLTLNTNEAATGANNLGTESPHTTNDAITELMSKSISPTMPMVTKSMTTESIPNESIPPTISNESYYIYPSHLYPVYPVHNTQYIYTQYIYTQYIYTQYIYTQYIYTQYIYTILSTSIPSTSIPSTSIPSTSIPSTSIPSTSIPSTSIPSTSIPSTSIPSTSQYIYTQYIYTQYIYTQYIYTQYIYTQYIYTQYIYTQYIYTQYIYTQYIYTQYIYTQYIYTQYIYTQYIYTQYIYTQYIYTQYIYTQYIYTQYIYTQYIYTQYIYTQYIYTQYIYTIPSTSIPSTSIPSTSIPSTSIPSTSIPSTSIPSTSIPSTSIPSTSIPSTSIPSTWMASDAGPCIGGIDMEQLLVPSGRVEAGGRGLPAYYGAVPTLPQLGYPPHNPWRTGDGATSPVTGGEGSALGQLQAQLEHPDTWRSIAPLHTAAATRNTGDVRQDLQRTHGLRLSPHLSHGCLSPRYAVEQCRESIDALMTHRVTENQFLELLTRFARRDYWVYYAYRYGRRLASPYGPTPEATDDIPDYNCDWRIIQRWCDGLTGVPLVDAGMREINVTGVAHDKVRQALSWFLTRGLSQDWRVGTEYFESRCIDFDPALCYGNFALNAGLIKDRFSFSNPMTESVHYTAYKHDPQGIYVKRWIPQLSRIPDTYVHRPHVMTKRMQQMHNCIIGKQYPLPVMLWHGTEEKPVYLPSVYSNDRGFTTHSCINEAYNTHCCVLPKPLLRLTFKNISAITGSAPMNSLVSPKQYAYVMASRSWYSLIGYHKKRLKLVKP